MLKAIIGWLVHLFTPVQPARVPVVIDRYTRR